MAGWVEFYLLRRTLGSRIGAAGLAAGFVARLWIAAAVAAAAAWAVKLAIGAQHPVLAAAAILGPYGGLYFAIAAAFGITPARVSRRQNL